MAKYNSVPLGRAGTGAAYILGESDAANEVLNNIDYNRQVQLQNEQLKRQYAQQLANDWKQNQLKIKGGTLWENELQSAASEVMDLGTKLRQAGFNPYKPNPNDPIQMQASELFLNKKRQVEDMADYREKIQGTLAEQHKLNDEKFGYFDNDTVASLNSFPTQYSLKDAYSQGVQAPTLRKAFNIYDDVLKNVKGVSTETDIVKGDIRTRKKVADVKKHDVIADQALATNNYLISDFKRRTGYEPAEVAFFGKTKDEISKELDSEFRGNPEKIAQLAQAGINFDTPQYKALIASQSDELFNVRKEYDNVKKTITDKLDNDVDELLKIDPDYTNAKEMRDRRMLQLAEQKAAGDGGVSAPRNVSIPYSDGKANVNVKNFIGLSIPAKNFAGSPAYNMSTGERIPALESSSDYEVVGVGNFPFINANVTDSNGKNLNGTLAQPSYQDRATEGSIKDQPMVHVQQKKDEGGIKIINDYLVPYDRLPDNVKNTKSVREALGKFKPAQHSTPKQQQNTEPKMVTFIMPNGVPGQVPADKAAEFQRKYPKAKRK